MSRTRRIALLAVLLLVGGFAVAGCGQARAGTAAMVAGVRITEQQVQDLVLEAGRAGAVESLGDGRGIILGLLVITELGRRVVAERAMAVPPADYEDAAQRYGIAPDTRLARADAEWTALGRVLVPEVQPAPPSDEDIRRIAASLRKANQLTEGVSLAELRARLRSDSDLAVAVGLRNLLRDAGDKYGLSVSPRYRPLVVFRALPLLHDADTVVDLPIV